MARTDTLGHFLTDVADAIRTAEGSSAEITASDFDDRIEALSGGGADLSDYFTSSSLVSSSNKSVINLLIKKIPPNMITVIGNSTRSFFYYCENLVEAPLFDTSGVINMITMFQGCTLLSTIPIYNTSSVENMNSMFAFCGNLTDTSLDNILQMCINAISYTGTKTLSTLGVITEYYPTSRIEALPHYQDFINAGWTIS